MAISNEASTRYVCATFCPLGRICNGGFAGNPIEDLRDHAASLKDDATYKAELTGLIDRIDNCDPQKVGQVMIDGIRREIYECPSSMLSGEKPQFIF